MMIASCCSFTDRGIALPEDAVLITLCEPALSSPYLLLSWLVTRCRLQIRRRMLSSTNFSGVSMLLALLRDCEARKAG
jgi:hypothetical protein